MANILNEVIDILKEHYGDDYTFRIDEVEKVNNVCLTGINIIKKDEKIAPIIYVDDFLKQFDNSKEIAEKIIDIYEENSSAYFDFDDSMIINFDAIKEYLSLRICNKQLNKEFLKNKIWYDFLDLAVYVVADFDGASITIDKNMAKNYWEMSEKDIMNIARNNVDTVSVSVRYMGDVLKDVIDVDMLDLLDCKMLVITNTSGLYGAVKILNTSIFESISNKSDSDLCIIPSSVHELIVLCIDENVDFEQINSMIKSVNETELSPKDVLSDHAYVYNRAKKCVDLVENYAHF